MKLIGRPFGEMFIPEIVIDANKLNLLPLGLVFFVGYSSIIIIGFFLRYYDDKVNFNRL